MRVQAFRPPRGLATTGTAPKSLQCTTVFCISTSNTILNILFPPVTFSPEGEDTQQKLEEENQPSITTMDF
jgi:hypothetical protein